MLSEQIVIAGIEGQIASNRRKNIYHRERDSTLTFTSTSRRIVGDRRGLRAMMESGAIEGVIDFTVQRALKEFFLANQYIDVTASHVEQLRDLYRHALGDAISGRYDADAMAHRHYVRLADWLAATSPITRLLYAPDKPMVEEVVCAEYSPALQLGILGIGLDSIVEPVIDIGCGEHANLVNHLRSHGIEAYGIDRLAPAGSGHLFRRNWFEVELKPGYWGTLISNLSFSSHFIHNHLRADGRHVEYARKYMELLSALAPGGSYHYAPGLPFIEGLVPADRFTVSRRRIDREHGMSIVRRVDRGK